jgi:hypothetical protein
MNSPDYFEDTYKVDSRSLTFLSTYLPPNCRSFVPDEKKVLTSLIDTMFITYPPICRIQILKLRKPRLAPYPPAPEVMFFEREGHTVKGAFQIMSDPDTFMNIEVSTDRDYGPRSFGGAYMD